MKYRLRIVLITILLIILVYVFQPKPIAEPVIQIIDYGYVPEEPQQPTSTTLGEYTITAYCSCEKCCGKWSYNRPKDSAGNDIVTGSSGEQLISGYSVASPLPFGTKIYIDNNEYIVHDRTANWIAEKYDNKIIDIYFSTHEEAVAFGKQYKEVYIKDVYYAQNLR